MVETLVSIMLLAISLTIVLQQISGALNGASLSKAYTRAVWHATEKMQELRLAGPLVPTFLEGEYPDGQVWQAFIEAAEFPDKPAPRGMIPMLVTVKVSWQQGRQEKAVSLDSLYLSGMER